MFPRRSSYRCCVVVCFYKFYCWIAFLWRLTPFCVKRPCHQLEPRIENYIILLILSVLVTNEKSSHVLRFWSLKFSEDKEKIWNYPKSMTSIHHRNIKIDILIYKVTHKSMQDIVLNYYIKSLLKPVHLFSLSSSSSSLITHHWSLPFFNP